ncbi:MAG: NAD(P)-dependent oxidoreductase [Phycisphaerales bacterium]
MTGEAPLEIAWIGTGVMGRSMAGHLLDAGHRLRVHSRTRAKSDSLVDRGARWCDSPAEASEGADLAISIVGMPPDVEAVHLGPDGTLAAATPPKVVVDMTTSSPALARVIAERGRERGVGAVDAPVSGGDVGARNASLSIMVGGDEPAVEAARPAFERMGRTIVHHGPAGAGQHVKMVNQILIAGTMLGMCEGLRYAESSGLDPEKVLASVGGGAAGSWSIQNLAPRILKGDFEPGFRIDHFLKDLSIALAEARSQGLDLPGLALAERLYRIAVDAGLAERGTQALVQVVAPSGGRSRG